MTEKMLLTVEIRDQKGIVSQGEAAAVTSKNSQGVFDVLPQHAHFISLIDEEIIITTPSGTTQKFTITRGIMRCFNNHVEVFTGLDSQITAEK